MSGENFFSKTILVYKLLGLSRVAMRSVLNVQNVELKQARFYQEVWADYLLDAPTLKAIFENSLN